MRTKVCRRCNQKKLISEFGNNRHFDNQGARDGKNIYCKVCVRTHEAARRARLKIEYPERKKMIVAQNLAEKERTLTAKVLKAIRRGFTTREAIKSVTRLSPDEVADALALLAFDQSKVRIVRKGEVREFHLNKAA